MRELWRSFIRLPQPHRRVALESLVAVPLAALALRVFGFRQTCRLVCRIRPNTSTSSAPLSSQACATVLGAVTRRAFPRTKCLLRSIALAWLLRRHGIASELRIGVRTQDGRLDAHAWVEAADMVINDSAEVRDTYRAFHGVLPAQTEWV